MSLTTMDSAPPSCETLYTGQVPVTLKHPDREDRLTSLTVEMSYGVGQPRSAWTIERKAAIVLPVACQP